MISRRWWIEFCVDLVSLVLLLFCVMFHLVILPSTTETVVSDAKSYDARVQSLCMVCASHIVIGASLTFVLVLQSGQKYLQSGTR
ncbi:hypothetical protein C8R46DRAFT_1081055 [Mycena filopes]|nr:hypothetical protein C8R46DRAFT_1081055 [Mycena filopes]